VARKGELHHKARLTQAQAAEIRELYAAWKAAGARKGYAELGAMFGVRWDHVRDIVKGRYWKPQETICNPIDTCST
jgi:hypothetical protein